MKNSIFPLKQYIPLLLQESTTSFCCMHRADIYQRLHFFLNSRIRKGIDGRCLLLHRHTSSTVCQRYLSCSIRSYYRVCQIDARGDSSVEQTNFIPTNSCQNGCSPGFLFSADVPQNYKQGSYNISTLCAKGMRGFGGMYPKSHKQIQFIH